jgi:phage terminase large subunit-like protein
MNDVLDDKVESSQEIKDLMSFLQAKLDDNSVVIKHDVVDRAIELTERYFFKMLDWQKFFYAFVFGVYYDDDTLMFNEYLAMMGRGAGKNGLIAAISFNLIYMLDIQNYDVNFVANTEKQAKTSFKEIWDILESDKKKFRKHFKWTKEMIVSRKSNSAITFSTSNPKSGDGGRPGAIMFDEVHAYEDEEQIKVHTSGLGKREDPRRFYITTDGNVRDGFLDQLKREAKMILAGERPNRRTFPMIYKLDDEKEVDDFDKWEKANPSVNHFTWLKQEMLDEYEKLEDRPSSRIEFMTKRMNIPAQDSYNAVAEWDKILATNQEMPDLTGYECIGGVDFADTMDFVGVGLLFKKDDKTYWKHHTFINHQSLEKYNYKVPIDVAKERGDVTILYTETNRPEDIAAWFLEQAKYYRIKMIASDLFRINFLTDKFKEYGLPELKIARSGTRTHTQLQPIVEDLFAYEKLVYGDDLMMRWYTNNTYVERDGKGNITYEKIDPKLRKTDGFFAFLHALQFADEINQTKVSFNRKLKTYTY